ncbi:MAG: hypothetical protein WA913_12815, partial [Pricia sp.]
MNRRIIVVLLLLAACSIRCDSLKGPREIENLRTFAKAYGYIKYFHPSDEASELDWKRFATFGASKVLNCRSDEELIERLREIFGPIAPSVIFTSERDDGNDGLQVRPPNPDNMDLTFWQHRGVGIGMNANYRSPYESVRVNSPIKRKVPKNYGLLISSIDAKEFREKRIRIKMMARLDDTTGVSAYVRLASIGSDGGTVLEKKDIRSTFWTTYEIVFAAGESIEYLEIGAALKGDASLYIDDVRLSVLNSGTWETIPLENGDFEKKGPSAPSVPLAWSTRGDGYDSKTSKENTFEGKSSGKIFRHEKPTEMGKRLFGTEPGFGESVNEKIGSSVFCNIPLVLYTDESGTYPRTDSLAI